MTHPAPDPKTVTFSVDVMKEDVPLRAYCVMCDAELSGRDTLEFQLRAHARKHR